MDNTIAQILWALISIIATLIGGTGTTIAVKNGSKNKSLERELGELKANQQNQRQINVDFKKDLKSLDYKIEEIKNILIESFKGGKNNA